MNEKGFTLIEVMISIMLLGILAIAFIPILTSQYVNVYRSGDKSEATYDALTDIEEQTSDPETKKIDKSKDTVVANPITFGDKTIDTIYVKEVVGEGKSVRKTKVGEGKGKYKDRVEETIIKVGVPVDATEENKPVKP